MAATHAEASRERRDIVSGEVMDEAKLIRFVAGPDGAVVPDLARKLPGRGLWVAADRSSVETAAKKNHFAQRDGCGRGSKRDGLLGYGFESLG